MQTLEFAPLEEEGDTDTPLALQRMSDWRLDFPVINIRPMSREPIHDCLPQLKTVLRILPSLRTAPGVHVHIKDFSWTEPMAQALVQASPHWDT